MGEYSNLILGALPKRFLEFPQNEKGAPKRAFSLTQTWPKAGNRVWFPFLSVARVRAIGAPKAGSFPKRLTIQLVT
jgi:hypothetical protein